MPTFRSSLPIFKEGLLKGVQETGLSSCEIPAEKLGKTCAKPIPRGENQSKYKGPIDVANRKQNRCTSGVALLIEDELIV